jgi:hypothetical protein
VHLNPIAQNTAADIYVVFIVKDTTLSLSTLNTHKYRLSNSAWLYCIDHSLRPVATSSVQFLAARNVMNSHYLGCPQLTSLCNATRTLPVYAWTRCPWNK